ncbi:SCO family protein [Flavicella sp.]|uniref:SCO family protein n=1 Tax=Flavicella sp. TaxID=2957742 RepID=UPI00261F362A|nr:SCO family protein [Flavicella sp.]MDG1804550.1 SCO family protein [Flavicella sp.]MDG2280395.1 SCO family protein [Flavicella sp.]
MEIKYFKKSIPTLLVMLVFSVVGIFVFYKLLTPEKKLPVYSPIDVNPRLVDASLQHVKKNHKIANFALVNQNAELVTEATFKDKIYVADFFFTRCGTICPIMTTNMVEIQKAFLKDDDILLLSHSVTPVMDSVSVLKEYAMNKEVVDAKWHLVTGEKKEIYNLARKSYFAVLDEGDGGSQDFIHTEQFILVDKKKRIRGYYDGTDPKEIQRIIEDIHLLKKE